MTLTHQRLCPQDWRATIEDIRCYVQAFSVLLILKRNSSQKQRLKQSRNVQRLFKNYD